MPIDQTSIKNAEYAAANGTHFSYADRDQLRASRDHITKLLQKLDGPDGIENMHVLRVSYGNDTINIKSLRFNQSIRLSKYGPRPNLTDSYMKEFVIPELTKRGFNIVAKAEFGPYDLVISDTFKGLHPEKNYEIWSDYGNGYEQTTSCDDLEDARRTLRDYRENQPEYPHKIKIIKD